MQDLYLGPLLPTTALLSYWKGTALLQELIHTPSQGGLHTLLLLLALHDVTFQARNWSIWATWDGHNLLDPGRTEPWCSTTPKQPQRWPKEHHFGAEMTKQRHVLNCSLSPDCTGIASHWRRVRELIKTVRKSRTAAQMQTSRYLTVSSRQWQRFPPRGTAVNYCKAAANAQNGELHEIAEFFLKNVFLKKFPALWQTSVRVLESTCTATLLPCTHNFSLPHW